MPGTIFIEDIFRLGQDFLLAADHLAEEIAQGASHSFGKGGGIRNSTVDALVAKGCGSRLEQLWKAGRYRRCPPLRRLRR